MSQAFENWLKENRKRDENVASAEMFVKDLRLELQKRVIKYFDEAKDEIWCNCDVCVLTRIAADEKESYGLVDRLALVGLEYLLGENFNRTAAMNYYTYVEKERE